MSTGKRIMDICGALVGLIILFILLLPVAVLIKLEDGGPVFFRQVRVGRRGRHFNIIKFRTMVPGAGATGRQLTVGEDPRLTRVGRRLRRYKLDELPQMFNVLRGEMTLVGPRPEVPRYTAMYNREQRRVLELTPGITDPASLLYRDESSLLAGAADPERDYVEKIMPEKLRLNLAYAARATVCSDLKVIWRTVFCIFFRPGATTCGAVAGDEQKVNRVGDG